MANGSQATGGGGLFDALFFNAIGQGDIARQLQPGIFGGGQVGQGQQQASQQQAPGPGLPSMAPSFSTPQDPYAPWLRPDIATHTQNVLSVMGQPEARGFQQLDYIYGMGTPPASAMNPEAYIGLRPLGALATGGSGMTPQAQPQQQFGGGQTLGGLGGQQLSPDFPQPQMMSQPDILQTLSQLSGGMQGAGAMGAGMQQQQGGLPPAPAFDAMLPPTPQVTPQLLSQMAQQDRAMQGAAPISLLPSFRPATGPGVEPNLNVMRQQMTEALQRKFSQPGALERYRERLLRELRPTETRYGQGLTFGGPSADRRYTGSVADAPAELGVGRGMFQTEQDLFRAVLGEEAYNRLLRG